MRVAISLVLIPHVLVKARALCPQHAAKDKHRFLIGTCSLHDSNELNVLEYFEDTNHFEISAQYPHPDQIWSVESCPYDSSLVLTSRQNSKGLKSLTLWKMERQEAIDLEEIYSGPAGLLELEEKCSFGQSQKPAYVEKFAWNKNNQNQNALLTIDNKVLTLWDIQNSKVSVRICGSCLVFTLEQFFFNFCCHSKARR